MLRAFAYGIAFTLQYDHSQNHVKQCFQATDDAYKSIRRRCLQMITTTQYYSTDRKPPLLSQFSNVITHGLEFGHNDLGKVSYMGFSKKQDNINL